MKRRTLIQSALVAAPLAASTALASGGSRLFGKPGSVVESANVTGGLRIPLSNTGIPEQYWGKIRGLTELVTGVLNSASEAAEFSTSPAAYLNKHGIDSSDPVLQDENVRLLAVISNPSAQAAINNRDYSRLFKFLTASGALSFNSTRLQDEISKSLSKNAAEVSALIGRGGSSLSSADREALLQFIEASGGAVSEDDLALTYTLINSELPDAAPMAISVVAIALALVTAVAVGFVAVYVAVWVIGGPVAGAQRSFSNTNFAKLLEADPTLSSSYERVARIAALTGDPEIFNEGTRSLITAECGAIIGAMRQQNIIRLNNDGADRLIEALSTYSYRVVGV
ncbi:hypothetical protein [Stenotrophomonas sp. SY1]|uniref:hypothetical protein n=1 Tax=Stenotrophomonas sp. SY1 TaxID=477235 RepID=UPI001E3687BC|nr:hypothetical protein [Stenotrophomonas sp. SY1]MCD9087700.1 hypothetical protein [Stenotrophomonas sp. SY1]